MECLSSQGSADSISPSAPGCGQFFIASKIDMLKECFCPECGKGHFAKRQFTETFVVSDWRNSELTWTSFTAGSRDHAKTSQAPAKVSASWLASEADFISKSKGSSASAVRDLYFSKTSRQLELVASTSSSNHLPSSGMTVGGRLYQPPKLAPRTYANDGSSWPTPTARDWKDGTAKSCQNVPVNGLLGRAVHLWPTPRAQMANGSGPSRIGNKMDLQTTVKFATPQARDFRIGQTSRWESPDRSRNLNDQIGGSLNPSWVEWLMGFPNEWTVLDASVTQWFQSKRKSRSKDCAA